VSVSFLGFHGTLASRLDSIKASGIYPSDNPDDWLGEGTYFFVRDLDDPETCAAQWARCKAWDKRSRAFEESKLAVVAAHIVVDESTIFDLRKPPNAQEFHRFRRQWLGSTIPNGWSSLPRPEKALYDTDVFDAFKMAKGISALIGEFHIQFSVSERHLRLDSRIPNATVLCLTNGVHDISIKIVESKIGPVGSFPEPEVQ
jgi:hypothetical protein